MAAPSRAACAASTKRPSQSNIETDINISDSDGCLWADASTGLPCGTFVYPAQLGGNRVFNANGIPQNTIPIIANFTGRNLTVSMPPALASAFANPNGWTMKTLEANDNYDRRTSLTALRFDGQYDFNHGFRLKFGVRDGIRSGDNQGFTFVTPVYGGIGATNPNGTPNATGCLVRYAGSDVILSGNGTPASPDPRHAQHLVYRGQCAGVLPGRRNLVTTAIEDPAAARQQLPGIHQPARVGDHLLGDRSKGHRQSHGVLAVALSQYHDTGGAWNHLARVDEGVGELSAGRPRRGARRHAVQR